jgi:TetR/AcrR family transcriptional repressor of nem operon
MANMNTAMNTKDKLLEVAQLMIQTRGYNAFSYADLAKLVKIRKASIHYYFPAKVDIGIAVTRQYREQFLNLLTEINNQEIPWLDKIKHYIRLYQEVLNDNRICLCGSLAADIRTLPKKLQNEVRLFFSDNIDWLAQILPDKNTEKAQMLLSTLQGAMLMAGTQANDKDVFSAIVKQLLNKLN